jgi:hypothetical protein
MGFSDLHEIETEIPQICIRADVSLRPAAHAPLASLKGVWFRQRWAVR